MERSDWEQLEKLCRQLHEEYPENTHPMFESVRMTGAFAASVLAHWGTTPPTGNVPPSERITVDEVDRELLGDDEAEYKRGIEDTKRAQERGPAGSPEREEGFREMEAQWEREGFDG